MVSKLSSSSPTWVNRWEVSSHTNPDKKYVVGQKSDGSWGCACPRWKFQKSPREDCKHIIGIKTMEPIDHTRTSPKAAEEFARFGGRVQNLPCNLPVFLTKTRRSIRIPD